jgi:hypothetical protein
MGIPARPNVPYKDEICCIFINKFINIALLGLLRYISKPHPQPLSLKRRGEIKKAVLHAY